MYIRAAIISDLENGLNNILQEFNEEDTINNKHLDIAFLATTGTMFVMTDGDRVIGAGTLIIDQKFINSKRVARIEEVVIDSAYRNKGLGKELITFLTNEADLRGCYKVLLTCNDNNVGFYEKCGFFNSSNCMRKNLNGQ